MEKFIWASAHKPTPEQIQELGGEISYLPVELQEKLNNTPSTGEGLVKVAIELLKYATDWKAILVQPGGSPAFQCVLGSMDTAENGFFVRIMYAHSERVSNDEPQADGSIKKVSVFKHIKFIEV